MSSALRLDIQGLRALAVVAVIAFHVNADWLPGGYIGVDVFFVISGFLITSILIRQKSEGTFQYARFYKNRVTRIAPAYFATLGITAVAAAVLMQPTDFAYFWSSLKRAMIFASNSYFATAGDYFAPSSHEWPLLHTWSLAVEMQFYLLLPLLVLQLSAKRLMGALLLLTVATTLVSQYMLANSQNSTAVYFSLWARVPEFLVGALAAAFKSQRLEQRFPINSGMAWVAVGLLGVCLFLMDKNVAFPGAAALLPCIAASTLLLADAGTVTRLLASPVLVWIGERSYSLYLWHWPLLAFLRYFTGDYVLDWPVLLAYGVAVLLVSHGSYHFVEAPFRQTPYGKKRLVTALTLGLLALLGMTLSRTLNQSVVDPPTAAMTRYAEGGQICHGKIVGSCIRGYPAESTPWLLIGDSHGAQLNLFVDEIGRDHPLSLRVITASSCIPIADFDVERIADYAREECIRQTAQVEKASESATTIIVAGKWTYHVQSERFLKAMADYLDKQQKKGVRVILLAQVPLLAEDPMRIQRWIALGLPTERLAISPEWAAANDQMKRLASGFPNAAFWDPSARGFFDEAPFAGKTLLYGDRHHLNEAGARLLGRHAGDRLHDLLKE